MFPKMLWVTADLRSDSSFGRQSIEWLTMLENTASNPLWNYHKRMSRWIFAVSEAAIQLDGFNFLVKVGKYFYEFSVAWEAVTNFCQSINL